MGRKETEGWSSDVPAGPFEVPKEMTFGFAEGIKDL